MEKRIYVGNLPFSVSQEQLRELFAPYGEIEEATVITNKFSGRSKGFGFVSFKNEESVEKAISEMNKKEIEGREIVVKEAMPFDSSKPRKRFERKGRFGGRRGSSREEKSEEAPSEEETQEQLE